MPKCALLAGGIRVISRPWNKTRPASGFHEARDQIHQGGLTGSIGTDDPKEAGFPSVEAHRIDGRDPAESFGESGNREKGPAFYV